MNRTESALLGFARRWWPELPGLPIQRRVVGLGDVITATYAIPLAVVSLAALVRATDLELWRAHLFSVWLLAALLSLFNRLRYFFITRIRSDRYGSADGSLDGVVLWTGLLLYGPGMLWLSVFWVLFDQATAWANTGSTAGRWRVLRALTLDLATQVMPPLLSLWFYRGLGGRIPIPDLEPATILRAGAALLVNGLLAGLIGLGYFLYVRWAQRNLLGETNTQPLVRFFALNLVLSQMANPFGILGAGLWASAGLPVFLFFSSGMLVVAFLARQLSWAGERSRQQSQVLLQLEKLGNAVINMAPADAALAEVLRPHLPAMFPAGNLVVWTFPDEVLYLSSEDWNPDLGRVWPWLARQREAAGFLATERLPWEEQSLPHNPVVVAPILDVESSQPIGGAYLELFPLAQPWNRRSLSNLPPALQSLATLVASALNQLSAYYRTLDLHRVEEELRLAGAIQASFLPLEIPRFPGWQVAVTLRPAGETSGDFFDLIPLPDGRVGLVIADVLDKGIGAALYMALSRTLLRTYAMSGELLPEAVVAAANERILADTSSNLFVTAFYGVLDPGSGRLTYCNAGHNPPYLVRGAETILVQELVRTGIPIGVERNFRWGQSALTIQPGDLLILYTDGIPEAQNQDGEFFTARQLLEAIKQDPDRSAEAMQARILERIDRFVGEAAQADDITLMLIARDPLPPATAASA
jgi:serine phosphatase RsbU (regulator of sigma subunit)